MPHGRSLRSFSGLLPAALMPLAATGCAMLGEIFYTRGLRIVVLAVIALAAVGLLASRTNRR